MFTINHLVQLHTLTDLIVLIIPPLHPNSTMVGKSLPLLHALRLLKHATKITAYH